MIQIMKEKKSGTIRTYEIDGLEVCIIETEKMFDAWVTTAGINEWDSGSGGVATYILGTVKEQENGTTITYDMFLEFIINELEDGGTEYYKEDLEELNYCGCD